MRYFSPELDGRSVDELMQEFYAVDNIHQIEKSDRDGNKLSRLLIANDTTKKRWAYYFGRELLKAYFNVYPYSNTQRTIAQLATAIGVAIDTNFTDATNYTFIFQSLIGRSPFQSSLWFTIFTDAGLYFAIPKRRDGAVQISGDGGDSIYYRVITDVMREPFFDETNYTGETANILRNADYKNCAPVVMDSTHKKMVVDKAISMNRIVTIQVTDDRYVPGDFFSYDGTAFIVMSKREINTGLWEYIGVKETDGTYTISGGDETPVRYALLSDTVANALALNGYGLDLTGFVTGDTVQIDTAAKTIKRVVPDTWHYVGAGGEPAFGTGWANYGGSEPLLRFKKLDNGQVKIEGSIKNGTSTTIFTLPVGYRPITYNAPSHAAIRNSATTTERVYALTTGVLYIATTTGNTYVLINYSFGID